MKKTLRICALLVTGALLAGCTPAESPAREAQGGISTATDGSARENSDESGAKDLVKRTNIISSIEVTEFAMAEGPSLIVTVQMANAEGVSADVIRQAVAESLAQASSAPSQVALLFVHGEVFIDSQAAANEVLPGVEFSSGGPTFTGDQARAIVG